MSFLSKLFGASKPKSQPKVVPDGATFREVVTIAVNSVIEEAGGNCATLELASDSGQWVQIMDLAINCNYPHRGSPDGLFPELIRHPLVAGLESFEANQSMTVSLNQMDVQEMVDWIESYFRRVFSVDVETARVRLKMEEF